jgi:endonuclease/exonuclease/phosphatase family metal-dependent hydrolase
MEQSGGQRVILPIIFKASPVVKAIASELWLINRGSILMSFSRFRLAGGFAAGALVVMLTGCSSQSSSTNLPTGAALSPASLSSPLTPAQSASPSNKLKVMTFNLRVATIFDLWNTWGFRRGQVVERIRSFEPDLLGTQEGLNGMEDFLKKHLPDYTFFGVGRNDGKHRGEFAGIFYKTNRFEKLDGGNFWLSRDPSKVGSKSWGEWFPRLVTWVKLQPRDGGQPFYWFNTHFAAFSGHARDESAKLLLSRITTLCTGLPCIVTGDFNANAGSKCFSYETLTSQFNVTQLVDAFRASHPVHTRDEGTRHDFNGHRDGDRIDWILASPSFQPLACQIDRTRGLLGYPSDHFPVKAIFRLPDTSSSPRLPVARADVRNGAQSIN